MTPLSTPAAQGTVAGWKLVPVNPTPEMMERYQRAFVSEKRFDGAEIYRAMIAAAPASLSPEALPASGVDELVRLRASLAECAHYIISPLRLSNDQEEAARRADIYARAIAALSSAPAQEDRNDG